MKLDGTEGITPAKLPDVNLLANNMQKTNKDANELTENQIPTEAEKKILPVSEKFIIDAIEKANKAIEGTRTEFKFSIHKETHEISVKVIDKDNGEVIREIPPEKVLDMVAKMWEMAGIIVDEKR